MCYHENITKDHEWSTWLRDIYLLMYLKHFLKGHFKRFLLCHLYFNFGKIRT